MSSFLLIVHNADINIGYHIIDLPNVLFIANGSYNTKFDIKAKPTLEEKVCFLERTENNISQKMQKFNYKLNINQ